MEEKIVTITIAPGGRSMKVDADNFHGEGCGSIMESFNAMGVVTEETQKPEYYESNQTYNTLQGSR